MRHMSAVVPAVIALFPAAGACARLVLDPRRLWRRLALHRTA